MQSGKDYTFAQIVDLLKKEVLRDSPSLGFYLNGMEQVINHSHCPEDKMLAVPNFAESLWTYKYETEEWFPIFVFSKHNVHPIESLVDMEPNIDPYAEREGTMWVTPKGLPREQYHRVVNEEGEEPYITDDDGDRYPLPVFDTEGKSEHFYLRANNPGGCDKCKQQVEKRVGYRDPTEGNCRLYEVCIPCRDHQHKIDAAEFADG